jgi:repressor LexA
LRALARKGVIEMTAGASRGIRLIEDSGLPVIGRVAAGAPILAEQHIDSRVPISAKLFSPAADYLLRVKGMSMRDAGILDGDLLAVHRTSEARDGQIVVARIDEEVTVKRLRRGRDRQLLELLPENPEFEPIRIDLRRTAFAIEGISVGVLRIQ